MFNSFVLLLHPIHLSRDQHIFLIYYANLSQKDQIHIFKILIFSSKKKGSLIGPYFAVGFEQVQVLLFGNFAPIFVLFFCFVFFISFFISDDGNDTEFFYHVAALTEFTKHLLQLGMNVLHRVDSTVKK